MFGELALLVRAGYDRPHFPVDELPGALAGRSLILAQQLVEPAVVDHRPETTVRPGEHVVVGIMCDQRHVQRQVISAEQGIPTVQLPESGPSRPYAAILRASLAGGALLPEPECRPGSPYR